MKVIVNCSNCGASFSAPKMLIGQTVKCPACSASCMVPKNAKPSKPNTGAASSVGGTPAAPPSDGIVGGEGPAPFDFGSLAPEASGTPIPNRSKPKRRLERTAGVKSEAVAKEQGGGDAAGSEGDIQGRMERLYGIYAGEELQKGRKGKFTLGLGIMLAFLLISGGVGFYVVKNTFQAAPPTIEEGPVADAKPAKPITAEDIVKDSQSTDLSNIWSPITDENRSEIKVEKVKVDVEWIAKGSSYMFDLRVKQAKNAEKKLNMSIKMVLYRSETIDGTYSQVAIKGVASTSGGETLFALGDGESISTGRNHVYYRLSCLDEKGKRIFDTPAQAFPVIKMPKVRGGHVSWSPVDKAREDVPMIRLMFYLAIPGWEDVLYEEISGRKALSLELPKLPMDAPFNIVMATIMPRGIEVDGAGHGRWREDVMEYALGREGKALSEQPGGVIPVGGTSAVSVKMLPSESAFADVEEQPQFGPDGEITNQILTFRPAGQDQIQMLELPSAAPPKNLVVTPYSDFIQLGWDNRDLVAGLDAYGEPIAVAVYREGGSESKRLIEVLDPKLSSYTDTRVSPNASYRYELKVTSAATPGGAPVLRTKTWIAGMGVIPVLIKHAPTTDGNWTMTDLQLQKLNISLGMNELCYEETGLAAVKAMDKVIAMLKGDERIAFIDRPLVQSYYAGGQSAFGGSSTDKTWLGMPGHIQIQFVDHCAATGNQLQLWLSDLVGETRTKIYEAKAADLDPNEVVMALSAYLQPLLRTDGKAAGEVTREQPEKVVLQPLIPVQQHERFMYADEIGKRIATGLGEAYGAEGLEDRNQAKGGNGATMAQQTTLAIGGRVWTNGDGTDGLSLHAVDVATGEMVDSLQIVVIDGDLEADVAAWSREIKVAKLTNGPRRMTDMVKVERDLGPLHPVWQRLGNGEKAQMRSGRRRPMAEGMKSYSFGLKMPASLQPYQGERVRNATEELAGVRPYVAPEFPLMFDEWTKVAAQYIEADHAAYKRGIEALNADAEKFEGMLLPRIYVRGREVYSAHEPMAIRSNSPISSELWITANVLKLGDSRESVLQYHQDLVKLIRRNPWAMSQAFKHVKQTEVASPLLKILLHGLDDQGRYKRLDLKQKIPPRFEQYAAAAVLVNHGHGQALRMLKEAGEISRGGIYRVENGRNLSSNNRRLVTDAVYGLLYANDSYAIGKINDQRFRDQYMDKSMVNADSYRMMIDRCGPGALGWKDYRELVNWREFIWRDANEMRSVTDEFPELFERDHYVQLRTWLNAPIKEGLHHRMPRNGDSSQPSNMERRDNSRGEYRGEIEDLRRRSSPRRPGFSPDDF
ncbi:hypothetical protein [Poriferisphaera sp. WC338]|uniref:hypothetical protein n=1 Tax=Poriferisphaera sp. WC338 TaxID=3425129 RepID=UPI003D8194AB